MPKRTNAKKKKRKKKRIAKAAPPRPPTLVEKPYEVSDGVTQSLLSSFVDCRMRCKLHLEGWRREKTKDSLEYGSLFHFLLETLYEDIRRGLVLHAGDVALDSPWWMKTLKTWRAKTSPTADATAIQQTEFCIAQARGVWKGYLKAYPQDFDQKRWVELEGVFDAIWRGFRLRGRRDGMMQFRKKLWLLETKTKSQIPHDAIKSALTFDFQNLFYITANQAELEARGEKLRIEGVKYNIVRRPQHKQKVNESLPDYSARIAEDVLLRPDHWFVRYEVAYPGSILKQHQQELQWKLTSFKMWWEFHSKHRLDGPPDQSVAMGMVPLVETYRNEAACQKRWNCGFIDMCGENKEPYHQDGRLFEELED